MPAAEAQVSASTVRIGWLAFAAPSPESSRIIDAFKEGLRRLGYVDGRNVAFEYRWAQGQPDRLPQLAAELVRLKVDVIAVTTAQGVAAARGATTTIPIVSIGPDADGLGLGSNLARPGGNVTGVSLFAGSEIGGKYLELLREAVPRASRVAILVRPQNAAHAPQVKEIETAARPSKLAIQVVQARTLEELDPAFTAMSRARAEALVVLPDVLSLQNSKRIADLATRSRLPAIYGLTANAEAGGLMSYAASFDEVAQRAGYYVDRILKGARPGDLPIERPTRFELVINARTAGALGLTLPLSLLARADRVIK